MQGEHGQIWLDLTQKSVYFHNPEKCHAKCSKFIGKFPHKYHINTQNQHLEDKYFKMPIIWEALQLEILNVLTLYLLHRCRVGTVRFLCRSWSHDLAWTGLICDWLSLPLSSNPHKEGRLGNSHSTHNTDCFKLHKHSPFWSIHNLRLINFC